MIRKLILGIAVAALATSLLPASSFAKKSHKAAKEPPCSFGQACTDKPAGASKFTGWSTAKRCSYDGKMLQDVFPCYRPGGACPAATCKPKKKK